MKNIFVYDDYKGKIAKFFINNAEKMNIVSCYYCDASYSGIYRVNKNHGRTFDVEHFFPNDQYPLFSLSLFNFVPSCQVCNSRVKGTSIFMNFYNLNHLNEAELRQCLLEISPTSQLYYLDKNVNIKIYPNIHFYTNYGRSCFSKWNYNPLFYRAINSYELYFDINEITFYQKPIDAMHINQRYNNIAIKSQALYLMDLKRRYPDSYIKKLSSILSKYDETKKYSSFKDIKKALFHEDNKYDLLQKLRKDTINNYQI